MPEKNNKQLLEEIISEIRSLKSAVSEIRLEIVKLNRIEQKLKKRGNFSDY